MKNPNKRSGDMKGSSGRIPVSAPPILQLFEPGFTSTNGDVGGGSDDNDDFQIYGDDSVMAKLRDLVRETIKEVESERKASLKEAPSSGRGPRRPTPARSKAPSKPKTSIDLQYVVKTALLNSREGAMNPEEYVRRAVVEYVNNNIKTGNKKISKETILNHLKWGLEADAAKTYRELAPIVLKAIEDNR